MVEVTLQESLRLAQDSSVESVTTNLQDVSKPMSEIDEMRAVRQEQDAFIARLTEDNAQLTATVENLESALCRLQTRLRRYTQKEEATLTREAFAEMAEGEAVGANESIVVRSEEQGDIDADVESLVLVEHAHCTADNCWRQKYMESLSQLRSVLVELRSELEEKSVLEEATRSQETRHQTKVQLIEESIRTLDVDEPEGSPKRYSRTGSRKRSFLGLDSSLRRIKQSRTSGSQTSLSKTPLLKKMINLFKKKPTNSAFRNR